MSTKDPIEDLFRDNQHGLDEKPRDLIWDRIEERLEEKPVVKKKSNGWKYAVAASVFAGISLAGLYFLNPNENPSKMESIVLMEHIEMTEEKASEILDQLEEESTAIATRKSHAPAPEIMEEEQKKPILSEAKSRMQSMEEIPSYDASEMAAPAPVAQMEMEGEKVKMKDKQEEVLVFRGESPTKKEGNHILRNADMDDRRLGNMTQKSVSYDTIYFERTVQQLPIKLKSETVYFDLEKSTKDSMVFINPKIKHPNKFILIQDKNQIITVRFYGDRKNENSIESKEIQKFVLENKNQIFDLGVQID
jgi:hypothetical protein